MEHSRKLRLVAAAFFILLALTCYFCWEILYQERAILNILRMSKDTDNEDSVEKALNSDHLEEVVDAWLEEKKDEVLNHLRESDADPTKLSKEELYKEMNKKFGSRQDVEKAKDRPHKLG